jgi:ribosomal protein S18 acetylase RimI-like enzyme
MLPVDLLIRPFEARDQEAARRLVLEGLGEHFGWIDESRNPDLDDIAASYVASGHVFIVAGIGARLVGTGALISEDKDTGRILRVGVAREHRRQGIGKALVEHLVETARHRGMTRIIVETMKEWDDAISLYRRCGFREYDRDSIDVHMVLELP